MYNFMHFEREMPFKMHRIIYFSRKKINKCVSLPYLKFSDLLPETQLFFNFAVNLLWWPILHHFVPRAVSVCFHDKICLECI